MSIGQEILKHYRTLHLRDVAIAESLRGYIPTHSSDETIFQKGYSLGFDLGWQKHANSTTPAPVSMYGHGLCMFRAAALQRIQEVIDMSQKTKKKTKKKKGK